jgi:hypothetical protein
LLGTTYNLENLSSNEFHLVMDVLKCLKETIGGIEGRIMLVGAQARDLSIDGSELQTTSSERPPILTWPLPWRTMKTTQR